MADHVVRLQGVSERFPGVTAVDGVDLEVRPGDVRAIAGDTGVALVTKKSLKEKRVQQMVSPTCSG